MDATSESTPQRPVILVADDEQAVLFVIQKTLERHGFEVLAASNGRDALALYQANRDRIKGILLDITMPDISGMVVVEELQAAGSKCPVVMMSGYSDSDEALHLNERGVAGFLEKPFRPSEAVVRLRAYFGIPKP